MQYRPHDREASISMVQPSIHCIPANCVPASWDRRVAMQIVARGQSVPEPQAFCMETTDPLACKALSIPMPQNKGSLTPLIPEYTSSQDETWRNLSMSDYQKTSDWAPSAVTRLKTNDLEPHFIGFLASSEDTANHNQKIHKNEYNNSNVTHLLKALTPIFPLKSLPYRLRLGVVYALCSHD